MRARKTSVGGGLRLLALSSALLFLAAATVPAEAAPQASKLDAQLQVLSSAGLDAGARSAKSSAAVLRQASQDDAGRIAVNIALRDHAAADQVAARVAQLGGRVNGKLLKAGRTGTMSVMLATSALSEMAKMGEVRALRFDPQGVVKVGATTSQGVPMMQADLAQQLGYSGKGITVAVLSDSFNAGKNVAIKYANDIATGDLPGPGNPNGKTTPVVVVSDPVTGGTDEGRAMLQIVHDVAPDAKLCFGVGVVGTEVFIDMLRKLSDPNGACKATVIVDDVGLLYEPMFSDGPVAEAIAELAAQGVHYFTAAGNNSSNMAYAGRFTPVDSAQARADAASPVNLSLIPEAATRGGFHNFAPKGQPANIAYRLTSIGSQIMTFQWNDLFDWGRVTTDYDIYVFSGDGKTLIYKGNSDNVTTDRAMEFVTFGDAGGFMPTDYQLVIARASNTPAQPEADMLRWVQFGFNTKVQYPNLKAPATFGHDTAAKANGVGATPWWRPYAAETFTSPGPVWITFDKDGNRLAKPIVLKKPDFVAPDDANNTFLNAPGWHDGDPFPNFPGTSAAAPHAAAVAALVLEKAGGPKAVQPKAMTRLLQQSAGEHILNPLDITAVAGDGDVQVTLRAQGNGEMPALNNPDAYQVRLEGPRGTTLQSLTIDLSSANPQRTWMGMPTPGMWFNPGMPPYPVPGFPTTVGAVKGITARDVSFSPINAMPNPLSQTLTLRFANNAFTPKARVNFGVGTTDLNNGLAPVNLLEGGTITAVVKRADGSSQTLTGVFANEMGYGWTRTEGWGLINAKRALDSVAAPRRRR